MCGIDCHHSREEQSIDRIKHGFTRRPQSMYICSEVGRARGREDEGQGRRSDSSDAQTKQPPEPYRPEGRATWGICIHTLEQSRAGPGEIEARPFSTVAGFRNQRERVSSGSAGREPIGLHKTRLLSFQQCSVLDGCSVLRSNARNSPLFLSKPSGDDSQGYKSDVHTLWAQTNVSSMSGEYTKG